MKIKSIVMFVLAFGLLTSTSQANLIGFLRGLKEKPKKEKREKPENPFKSIFNKDGPKFNFPKPKPIKPRIQTPRRRIPPGIQKSQGPQLEDIWKKLCGDNGIEWNPEGGNKNIDFGNLFKKFGKICGKRPDFEKFCQNVKTKVERAPSPTVLRTRSLTPQAPGSAVPEPSTYGVIGAGALLGLVILRRFKNKRSQ